LIKYIDGKYLFLDWYCGFILLCNIFSDFIDELCRTVVCLVIEFEILKNDEYVVLIVVKDTSVVENVLTAEEAEEPEEPVLVQKVQPNSTNDLSDIHPGPYRPILQVSYYSLLNTFKNGVCLSSIYFFVILVCQMP